MRRWLVLSCLVAGSALALPSGHRWFTLPPGYRIFTHASIHGVPNFSTAVRPRVVAAFAAWTKAQVSCTRWDVKDLGSFSTPTRRAALDGIDRQNRILWLEGSDWTDSALTLGITTDTYFTGTGEIIDADMAFNNNITWSNAGLAGTYDYESVVLHEAGHFLGLDHTPLTSVAVMNPEINPGEIKRKLAQPDLTDVCLVYPTAVGPGQQGQPCASDAACASPLKCRGAPGSASKICTQVCTATAPACPANTTCQTADVGKACLAPVGAVDLCHFCTQGSNCSTGDCVTDGQHNWCTRSCTAAEQCGAGYSCVTSNVGMVCAPTSPCNKQCTTASQCAVGYACTAGTCVAKGGVGDRCEVSEYCQACGICVGTLAEATCRPCCGGQGAGGACTSCTAVTCTASQSCDQVSGSTDLVCVEPAGTASCQACSATKPCADGQSCVKGRCHADCALQSPGACSACFDSGAGKGACACSDEIAYSGQACGATPSGTTRVCVTGLTCLGQPSVCSKPCVLGEVGGCQDGEVCTVVDGTSVCVQGSGSGAQCSLCNGTTCAAGLTCFEGRCYPGCVPSSPSCSGCVEVTAGVGVCVCDSQRAGPGELCGYAPPDVLAACQPGLTCAASGGAAACWVPCGAGLPLCPGGSRCTSTEAGSVCLPEGYDGGPPPPVDAGVEPDAGVDPPPNTNNGCGCGAGPEGLGVLALLAALGARRQSDWRRGRRLR